MSVAEPDRQVPPGTREAVCEACGKRIVFIEVAGVTVPLDLVAPTYQLTVVDEGTEDREPKHEWRRSNGKGVVEMALVSHFATCADPSRFSKSTRRGYRTRP